MSRSSKYQASPHKPSGSSVFTYLAPGLCENAPQRLRSTRGPFSRYFSGNQVCHTCAGSTTWSSTLMIFGSSIEALPGPAAGSFPDVSVRLPGASGADLLVDVRLAGGLVRVGVRRSGEAIVDPPDQVRGRRPDHARMALARVHPPFEA